MSKENLKYNSSFVKFNDPYLSISLPIGHRVIAITSEDKLQEAKHLVKSFLDEYPFYPEDKKGHMFHGSRLNTNFANAVKFHFKTVLEVLDSLPVKTKEAKTRAYDPATVCERFKTRFKELMSAKFKTQQTSIADDPYLTRGLDLDDLDAIFIIIAEEFERILQDK
jgi:hypothetical protein